MSRTRAQHGGRGTHVRLHAEYLGGTRIRFTYPCGHTETKDYSKGPVPKRMGEWACRRMANWWSKANGGVTTHKPCRSCARAALTADRYSGGK